MSESAFPLFRSVRPTEEAVRAKILEKPGFGDYFTDHMAHIRWTSEQGWHDRCVRPYGAISVDPAASVLHYAQEIFEGMKAYRHADGSIWTFRPGRNAARFNTSAARLALPQMAAEDFIAAVRAFVSADANWVPTPASDTDEASLYLRPFMFATEAFLGVRPSRATEFYVIGSPAGAYFPNGVEPVAIWLSERLKRASAGGTGFAKCGGNYAASMEAQLEAAANGCAQVLFTDAGSGECLEELGGMNIMLISSAGELLTPALSDSILDGVTRRSLLDLAPQVGLTAVERPIAVAEWRERAAAGDIVEAFACGTAAVITPIGSLRSKEFTIDHSGSDFAYTLKLRTLLLDIQYGRAEDPADWMVKLAG